MKSVTFTYVGHAQALQKSKEEKKSPLTLMFFGAPFSFLPSEDRDMLSKQSNKEIWFQFLKHPW